MTDTGLIYYWYRTDIDWYRSPRVHKPWIETLPKNSIPDFWGRVWDAVIDGNGWEQKFPLTPASQLCGFISLQNGIQRRSQYHKFVVWCFIKCLLKLPAWDDSWSHWLHLCGFSPLCVLKCVLKLNDWEAAKSHWLHLYDFSRLCIFKWLLKALS